MHSPEIIIYVSSKNNYKMLEHEVLNNISFDGFEFVNVDDNSNDVEQSHGKLICAENNITYLQNKGMGVQMATETLIDFISNNRPECKWIICFQHDNYPITLGFFAKIAERINAGKLDEFGAMGFNVLDRGKYTRNAYDMWKLGKDPMGMLGLAHCSIYSPGRRWISPHHNDIAVKNVAEWNRPFMIEFPMWAAIGFNVKNWIECVIPTEDYQFHLWAPDVCFQLNYHNKGTIIFPDLYCLNDQELKSKYDINPNSVQGSKSGDTDHFGEYGPHLEAWKDRWGWDYENTADTLHKVMGSYEGTLIEEYFNHNIEDIKKPYKVVEI